MATFNEIKRHTNNFAEEMAKYTGLPKPIVLNIIQYARRLTHPSDPNHIEKIVFNAQMGLRFDITSMFIISLMFGAVRNKDTKKLCLTEYVKLICIICCENLDSKIDFVFAVYDFYHDDNLCPQEMNTLLKSSIVSSGDDDAQEALKELVDMVIYVFDTDGDGQINLEEFRALVKKDILYIQLLGQVLPHVEVTRSFFEMMRTNSALKIREIFEHERAYCLNEPIKHKKQTLYPVILDLP